MNRLCLGFAAGVMSAASVFSLILPAMEQAAGGTAWLVAAVGFAAGAMMWVVLAEMLPHAAARRDGALAAAVG